jgi:predicted deacylase
MPDRVDTFPLPGAGMAGHRTLTVLRYGRPGARPKAYLQAALHADEAPGYLVMHHLAARLERVREAGGVAGEIVLVPAANPIGADQWRSDVLMGRFDDADGVNFNRSFPDLADAVARRVEGELTEHGDTNVARIRQAAGRVLEEIVPRGQTETLKHRLLSLAHDADIVLDLHCDHEALFHVYFGESLWPDAADLPAQTGAAVTLLADDSGVTPFDEACSRLWWRLAERFPGHPVPPACLASTVELRGVADVDHAAARADADNLLRFLQRRGLVRGTAPPLPEAAGEALPLAGVEQVKAPCSGVVVFAAAPGDRLKKGDLVAEVVNPLAGSAEERVRPVTASIDGLLFARAADRFARPGRVLAKIAGKTPFQTPGASLLTP